MDDMSISRGAVDDDASRGDDGSSNSTEDGSFADADGASSVGKTTARHSTMGKLSRDKAKSLSKLPFADKQQLVREMFARREQGGKSALVVPKDNAGTSTSELDDRDGLDASGRGSVKKGKQRGVPLPGLNVMDDGGESLAAQAPRARPRARQSAGKANPDTDDDEDASESRARSRSASPGKTRGKRIPLKSGDEPRVTSSSGQKSSKSPAKAASNHRQGSDVAPSSNPQSNGGQSITIRLPSQPAHPPIQLPTSVALPPAFPSPYPAPSAATDKLLLRQTVSSFEQCLHHALDMNTALLAQITKQQPPTFIPNMIVPATLAHPSTAPTRSPQRPPAYPPIVPTDAQQPTRRAVEYTQGLHKIQDLIGKVQATTARHAKTMDVMVQAVSAERERRAADEVKGLVAQLAGMAAGFSAGGNVGSV